MNTIRKIGTLMLVMVNKHKMDKNDIVVSSNNGAKEIITSVSITTHGKSAVGAVYFSGGCYNTAIIDSIHRLTIITDDEINVGDTVLDCFNSLVTIKEKRPYGKEKGYENLFLVNESGNQYKNFELRGKVIVTHNQLSQKFLQAYIAGNVDVGDEVEVVINDVQITESLEKYDDDMVVVNGEVMLTWSHEDREKLETKANEYRNKPKLRPDGTAIIRRSTDTNVHRAATIYFGLLKHDHNSFDINTFVAGAKWREIDHIRNKRSNIDVEIEANG